MHVLEDILAPILLMEQGKALVIVQFGPRSLRLPRLEDVGI